VLVADFQLQEPPTSQRVFSCVLPTETISLCQDGREMHASLVFCVFVVRNKSKNG
jgi:hypothetical protein